MSKGNLKFTELSERNVHIESLSQAEGDWIRKFAALLEECPNRLGVQADIGKLHVYDDSFFSDHPEEIMEIGSYDPDDAGTIFATIETNVYFEGESKYPELG